MGLGELTPTDTDEESSASKSTYVTFENPRSVEIDEDKAHRHRQEYYDAVKALRGMLNQDINVPFGKFAVAAHEAESASNYDPMLTLADQITDLEDAAGVEGVLVKFKDAVVSFLEDEDPSDLQDLFEQITGQ